MHYQGLLWSPTPRAAYARSLSTPGPRPHSSSPAATSSTGTASAGGSVRRRAARCATSPRNQTKQKYMKMKEQADKKYKELRNKWINTLHSVNKYRPLSWAPAPEEEVQVEVEADLSQDADVSHRRGQKPPPPPPRSQRLSQRARQTRVQLRAFGFKEPLDHAEHDPDAQPPPPPPPPPTRRHRRRKARKS